MEIDRLATLRAVLADRHPLRGVRVEDLDLRPLESELLARTDLTDLVVLGGRLTPALAAHLTRHGAIVFPADPRTPVDVYRSTLYTPDELYAGLDGPKGYPGTPDARAYEWTRDQRAGQDPYATLLRAIHDESIAGALDEALAGRVVVGVMGGHELARDSRGYAAAARLGFGLAREGCVVATGGGPGAMEAANLGAVAGAAPALERALTHLAKVAEYGDDIAAWARLGLAVRADLARTPGGERLRSVGVPTWFYGHEPPNVFAELVAKYFSNALREDGLVARCTGGIAVLPGRAGTVQEVFQAATRQFYERDAQGAALVLVGRKYWQRELPAWPALAALAQGRRMATAVALVDTVEEALTLLTRGGDRGRNHR